MRCQEPLWTWENTISESWNVRGIKTHPMKDGMRGELK